MPGELTMAFFTPIFLVSSELSLPGREALGPDIMSHLEEQGLPQGQRL